MKTSNGFRFLLVLAVTFALQASAFAAHNIWFTNPTNGQKYFLQPGQSTMGVFVNINYEWGPYPYPYTAVKTKIKVDNGSWRDNITSFTTDPLSAGPHTLSAELWEHYVGEGWTMTATAQIGFTIVPAYVDIAVKNSFNGGTVVVDGNTTNSGTTFQWQSGLTHTLEASNQNYQAPNEANYFRVFNNRWERVLIGQYGTTNQISILADGDATYEARFVKQFDILFQNNFIGVGNGGVMNVNGTQYNLPRASFPVLENANSIQAEALNNTVNGIAYTFSHWGDASTQRSQTFTPGDHQTYTAHFLGKPITVSPTLQQINQTGQFVRIQWQEHQNSNVTRYHIWRQVCEGPRVIDERQVTVVNRGTTTWTDHAYTVSPNHGNLSLSYDVRAYYVTEGTYADPDFTWATRGTGGNASTEKVGVGKSLPLPTAFSLHTYPNPFSA